MRTSGFLMWHKTARQSENQLQIRKPHRYGAVVCYISSSQKKISKRLKFIKKYAIINFVKKLDV